MESVQLEHYISVLLSSTVLNVNDGAAVTEKVELAGAVHVVVEVCVLGAELEAVQVVLWQQLCVQSSAQP